MNNKTPITEATHAHTVGEIRASATTNSDTGSHSRFVLLETMKRNNAAYESIVPQLEELFKVIRVKRRFDQSQ